MYYDPKSAGKQEGDMEELHSDVAVECACKLTHPYIHLSSGGRLYPSALELSTVNLVDIAEGLSKQCRFAGQIKDFYSVAQHSVLVSRHLPPAYALFGLLHDMAEFALGDTAKPVKVTLPDVNNLEDKLMAYLSKQFGLSYPFPSEVKEIDSRILIDEACSLFRVRPDWLNDLQAAGVKPLGIDIRPWGWTAAKNIFLCEFDNAVTMHRLYYKNK